MAVKKTLSTYALSLILLTLGISGFIVAVAVDDLTELRIDMVGVLTTGAGIVDFFVKRSQQVQGKKVEEVTNNQTNILLTGISTRLESLERKTDQRHEENQTSLRRVMRRIKHLEEDKSAQKMLHTEHDRRLTKLEEGHKEILAEVKKIAEGVRK